LEVGDDVVFGSRSIVLTSTAVRSAKVTFVIIYGSYMSYYHWYFLYFCLFGWSIWKFPRKKRKKIYFEGLGSGQPLLSVRLFVRRRKSVSHFKAREITFSGLITLRIWRIGFVTPLFMIHFVTHCHVFILIPLLCKHHHQGNI
jgi:hypothetical protein